MAKKLFIKIGIVLVLVIIIDFSVGRTLRYFFFRQTSGLHFRTTYVMEKTNADILIFGASRANHHYVPEVFEDSLKMSFYNAGRDGTNIFFQLAVLKSVLKRYTPKLIILDHDDTFDKSQDSYDRISSLLPYYMTHQEIRKIVELKSPYEKIKLCSGIYPFNSEVLTIAMGNLPSNQGRNPDNKGYVASYNEWNKDIQFAYYPSRDIDSNKINAFKAFISLAKKSNIEVIIFFSPIYQIRNVPIDIHIVNKICSEENVLFFDYSTDPTFLNNRQLFADIFHMNNKGATLFSSMAISKIKGDYKRFDTKSSLVRYIRLKVKNTVVNSVDIRFMTLATDG